MIQPYQKSKRQKKASFEEDVKNLPIFKLSHLELRHSTLSILTRRGFNSTADVLSSKGGSGIGSGGGGGGGISNFASELEVPIVDAVRISQEVERAIRSLAVQFPTKKNDNDNAANLGSGGNGTKTSSLHPETYHRNHRRAPQTAAQILSSHYNQPSSSRPIISFVRTIDLLLGGGFHPKEVIEIAGLPGVGKTQLAMQLCVDTHLPKQFGGNGAESIYIDSEGSFSPERCHDMAKALVDHVHNSAQRSKRTRNSSGSGSGSNNNIRKVVPQDFTTDSILDSIHVFRVYDETCQSATILSLPTFLKKRKEKGQMVKLVVIDSIAFHYRCSSSDYKSRTKSLTSTAAFLSDLANTFDLSIVVINQMTTKIGNSSNGSNDSNNDMIKNNSSVVPALGESWAHSTATRLLLMFDHSSANGNSNGNSSVGSIYGDEYGVQAQRRICKLVKSSHRPAGIASFSVTEFGLRDCVQ